MRIIILSAPLFLIFSCKKSNYVDYPSGKYELIAYDVENICDAESSGFNSSTSVKNKDIILNILEFDKQKNVIYESNNGSEKFKVLNCNIVNKETYFQKDGCYSTKHYQFILKNKLKKFSFHYYPINDSILIGVFWVKNQSYFSAEKPNVSNYTCGDPYNQYKDEFNMPKTPQQSFFVTELYGIFKKIYD